MKRIVLFSGGSACRTINIALSHRQVHLTRIVPAWDSGGSSKVIREKLGILSVGDIRQALMTMAHGEGRSGDVVRICNTRLSANRSVEEASAEFQYYAEGRHPLLERMEAGLRGAILNYLKTFSATVGKDFDFRNGSIGNFILTGACIAHNGDVNTAIFVFRKLCGITGNVWPCSLDSDLVLSATMKNGGQLAPQDAITKMSDTDSEIGIRAIELGREQGQRPSANPAALEAIERADLIAFGPGSFYTSILPHLLVDGVMAAVERANCPKVFIGNILQCRETMGMSLGDVVSAFAAPWRQARGAARPPFLHILGNQLLFPFEKTVGVFPYLADELSESGDHVLMREELEDAWNRGQHDGDLVADQLLAIASAVEARA
jgi:CofD-related protein of GAK system